MSNTTLSPASSLFDNSTTTGGPLGPPPWYQYPVCAVAPYGFIFYFGVKVFNLAIGTPCNILVIWKIVSNKSDASTCDIFIFNLAILDAYFCLMTPIEMTNRLLLGDSRIWYAQRFAYGIKDVAPLFLVCICLDRYMAVVHPVVFSGIRDNKIRTGISVVVWGLILAYGFTKCFLGVMSVNEVFSGVILFSFAVMVFCNISVIWVLRRSVAGKEEMHPVKKKALKMVLIILGIIVSNYLPPVALMPFVPYYTFVQFRCQISISVFSIMDLSCSMEPLLYITKMERVGGGCCGGSVTKKSQDVKV
ncbi:G-protein coupled receptor 4-like [Notolabrus celidotus]|uniref:G-protein coupled receptor 4-like n=1 Tax=Notolabrus celidotus TaxID=1203425 RepID=UPI0014901FB7|nr:G-protein coupled receptor 4-like [Notolabrus celidotus]XP_034543539.1 G-protein coupled receptor 4-like [Notolabrus celidotus]XP_034543540.1 G-protein coupled receptor 4-like [Notolabrus celidotus]XP_034543541.1 G-protein coupled receptor 4-like [Notolabrus celidotus]XP_034543542.1 G-protein coupled receptor 4-like [Notolabrus celidotus]XP_034543543.1 G-protein coupled receptor 4-like [Notolabrus celidotus]XP_034543545.1 G-protein coupled receptor 4-like [Notolabrus celidotus]